MVLGPEQKAKVYPVLNEVTLDPTETTLRDSEHCWTNGLGSSRVR